MDECPEKASLVMSLSSLLHSGKPPQRFTMEILGYLTITVFMIWCASEIVIGLISFRNRSKDLSKGADRFSYFIVWFSTVPPIGLEYLLRAHPSFANGFGDFSELFPLLGYLG